MDALDVEMEDTEKQDFELGNSNVQDSDGKGLDVDIQSIEGPRGDISSENIVSGDGSKTQTGEEGVLEQRDGMEEEMIVKGEMTGPVGDKIESCENKEVELSNTEQIFDIKDDKETRRDGPGQDSAAILAQKQNDANNDVVEEKSAIGQVGEEMTVGNGAGGASLDVSMVEESHNGETAAENPENTSKNKGDCIGGVAWEDLTTKNDAARDGQAETSTENKELPSKELSDNHSHYHYGQSEKVSPGKDNGVYDAVEVNGSNVIMEEPEGQNKVPLSALVPAGHNYNAASVPTKHEGEDYSVTKQDGTSTPSSTVRYPGAAGERGSVTAKTVHTQTALPLMAEDDDGTPEEQAGFMKEVESLYREKGIDFKAPKFYGQLLNCLKLWRAVIRLGGYDRVTASKLWRQVGESFHPPKTCTTVSWTFRIFYEKSLLEFERHKTQSGELQLPVFAFPEASGVDIEGNGYQGSARTKRDAASRAMQGQRLFTNGEAGEPVAKDKSLINAAKREKGMKGSLKQKRPNEVEKPVKAARTEKSKQLAASVIDIGPPADWVKINIREAENCFEVYALVPGLLREEVRVQSDPAGRLVITGQPEQVDNPWGITAFKKVVSLPGRIDPLQTSAVVSLHGRLFVRVPFEKPNST